MKDELKVGQIVFLKPVGNAARYVRDDILNNLIETEITKIGRKYFYVSKFRDKKFSLENMADKLDYGYRRDYEVYTDIQDIKDEIEIARLNSEIKKTFDNWRSGLTLEQLRRIKNIIEE